jgi:hypothetical protein
MLAPSPSPTDRRLAVASIPVASNNAVPVHRVRAVTSQQRKGAYIWTETSMPEAASNGVSDAGHLDVAPREAQSHLSAMGMKAPSQGRCMSTGHPKTHSDRRLGLYCSKAVGSQHGPSRRPRNKRCVPHKDSSGTSTWQTQWYR